MMKDGAVFKKLIIHHSPLIIPFQILSIFKPYTCLKLKRKK